MFDFDGIIKIVIGILALGALFLARGQVSTFLAVRKNKKATAKIVKEIQADTKKKVKDAERIRTVPAAKSGWGRLLDKARRRRSGN